MVLDVVVEVLVVEVEVDAVEVEVDAVVEVGGRVDVVVDDGDVLDVVVDELVVVAGVLSSFDAFRAKMINTAATATIKMASPHRSGFLAGLLPPPSPAAGSPGVAASGGGVTGLGCVGSVPCGSTTGIASVGSSAPGNSPGPLPPFGVSLMT